MMLKPPPVLVQSGSALVHILVAGSGIVQLKSQSARSGSVTPFLEISGPRSVLFGNRPDTDRPPAGNILSLRD